ncbi:MAG: XamI family restriction endonuclease, partial [Thermoguttaceae bacterium]
MIPAPRWSAEVLEKNSEHATEIFRKERLEEPLEDYLEAFDEYQGNVEDLFETTIDLTELDETAIQFLSDAKLFGAFRYLAGPPISDDDLKTVAEVTSLNASQLRNDPEAVQRIISVVRMGMDRRRFPWVREEREPTEAERKAAVLASAALMATQRVGTDRRSKGKRSQEGMVNGVLTGAGLVEVANRKVSTLTDAPEPGQFCGES